VVDGDAEKLARLRAICSSFPDRAMLYKESLGIVLAAAKEEKARMIGDGALLIEGGGGGEGVLCREGVQVSCCSPAGSRGGHHGSGHGDAGASSKKSGGAGRRRVDVADK
jgi:hypothetical protein